MLKNMASKFSPIKSTLASMRILVVIFIFAGIMSFIFGGDTIAFGAFIISVFSYMTSVAIQAHVAMREDIEKRLEYFYKPIDRIIGSPFTIENRAEDIIFQLQDLRRYDHLAKDKRTKDLLRQLTYASEATVTEISDIKRLLKVVNKDIRYYEESLDALSSK